MGAPGFWWMRCAYPPYGAASYGAAPYGELLRPTLESGSGGVGRLDWAGGGGTIRGVFGPSVFYPQLSVFL